jgi:hypothetical protein
LKAAFAATGINGEWYACRQREFGERLPWEHIHLGVKKEYLWREWERALELDRETRDQPGWRYGTHGAERPAPEEAQKQLEYAAWR